MSSTSSSSTDSYEEAQLERHRHRHRRNSSRHSSQNSSRHSAAPTVSSYCSSNPPPPPPHPALLEGRAQTAYEIRVTAAETARDREQVLHRRNGDELLYLHPKGSSHQGKPSYLASFTKGLPHDVRTGLVCNPGHFSRFVRAIERPSEDHIRRVPLGPAMERDFFSAMASMPPVPVRGWESMGAGSTFDLEGVDAWKVTMPPPPRFGSGEMIMEMAELYWMSLLRDIPLTQLSNQGRRRWHRRMRKWAYREKHKYYKLVLEMINDAVQDLSEYDWGLSDRKLSRAERQRRREKFSLQTVFRGIAPGDNVGPYISQFLLIGSEGLGEAEGPEDGFIKYGAMRMDQRVRVATPGLDFMTTWASFIDVQNGADVRGRDSYISEGVKYRFITTPRDLATYVHMDLAYQPYFNACVILLGMRAPFDEGIPFQEDDFIDKQQGFATFGGPHILTLVAEVTTRALKAVRFQKFNIHRRLRPEATGGLLDRYYRDRKDPVLAGVKPMYKGLNSELLKKIAQRNTFLNATAADNGVPRSEDLNMERRKKVHLLLPQAYPEGSPMHPTYGAGHATVAGACITVLKAWFDHTFELPYAFVPTEDGTTLEPLKHIGEPLTVEGELNKLASNIAVGRNWAGVHYFSDYWESVQLGEQVAISILEEQKLTYGEEFSMTLPRFDGSEYEI